MLCFTVELLLYFNDLFVHILNEFSLSNGKVKVSKTVLHFSLPFVVSCFNLNLAYFFSIVHHNIDVCSFFSWFGETDQKDITELHDEVSLNIFLPHNNINVWLVNATMPYLLAFLVCTYVLGFLT